MTEDAIRRQLVQLRKADGVTLEKLAQAVELQQLLSEPSPEGLMRKLKDAASHIEGEHKQRAALAALGIDVQQRPTLTRRYEDLYEESRRSIETIRKDADAGLADMAAYLNQRPTEQRERRPSSRSRKAPRISLDRLAFRGSILEVANIDAGGASIEVTVDSSRFFTSDVTVRLRVADPVHIVYGLWYVWSKNSTYDWSVHLIGVLPGQEKPEHLLVLQLRNPRLGNSSQYASSPTAVSFGFVDGSSAIMRRRQTGLDWTYLKRGLSAEAYFGTALRGEIQAYWDEEDQRIADKVALPATAA